MKLSKWKIDSILIGINFEFDFKYRPTWIYLGRYIIAFLPDYSFWHVTKEYTEDKYVQITKHIIKHTEPFNNTRFFNLGITFKPFCLFIGRYRIE